MKSTRFRNFCFFVALALVIGGSVGAQAEMITNGSFEDTTIVEWNITSGLTGLGGNTANLMTDVTGWTAIASPDPNAGGECRWYLEDTYAAVDASMIETPYGRLMFALGNSSAIYQEFSVAPGNEYTVSYYEVSRSDDWGGETGLTTSITGVAATGTLSQLADTPLASGWTLYSFNFTPTESGTARLTFTGASGNGGQIDNVSVTATALVPEPGTIALLVTGLFGLMAFAWRKRP